MRHPFLPCALAACMVVLAGACTWGGDEPTASPVPAGDDPGATSPGVPTSTAAPTSPSPTPSVVPSPTPTPRPVGEGRLTVTGARGTELVTEVGGDCMLSGALPDPLRGDAVADDVEVLLAVDNYVGPGGRPTVDQFVTVVLDGEADDAEVELVGGPVPDWPWWRGPVDTLVLAEASEAGGASVVDVVLTASLARGPAEDLGGPAPQPSPTGRQGRNRGGGGGGGGGGQGGSSGAGPGDGTAAPAVGTGTGAVTLVAEQASPSPTRRPIRALDLRVELHCAAVVD